MAEVVADVRLRIRLRPSVAAVASTAAGSRAVAVAVEEEALRRLLCLHLRLDARLRIPSRRSAVEHVSMVAGRRARAAARLRTRLRLLVEAPASTVGGHRAAAVHQSRQAAAPQLIPSRQLVVAPVRMEVGSRGMPVVRPRTHSRASAVACAPAAAGDPARSRQETITCEKRSRCDVGSFYKLRNGFWMSCAEGGQLRPAACVDCSVP